MLKYQSVICIIIFSLFTNLRAQEAENEALISRFRPGFMWFYTGVKPAETGKVRKYDRLIVDIHYNDWHGSNNKPFQNHWSSIGYKIQLSFDKILNQKNTISLGYGLGYDRTRIRFDDFLVRDVQQEATTYAENTSGFVTKSLFNVNAIYLPLELRFRTPGWKHVKFHVGGSVAYQWRPSTRYIQETQNSIQTEQITRGFMDFNPLNFRAYTRFGIRNWALTASYQFLPYFKSKQSTQLNGFNLGLSISLF
jgi:hypothetical protein